MRSSSCDFRAGGLCSSPRRALSKHHHHSSPMTGRPPDVGLAVHRGLSQSIQRNLGHAVSMQVHLTRTTRISISLGSVFSRHPPFFYHRLSNITINASGNRQNPSIVNTSPPPFSARPSVHRHIHQA